MGGTAYACSPLLQDKKIITGQHLTQHFEISGSPAPAFHYFAPMVRTVFNIHLEAANTAKKGQSTQMLSVCIKLHVCSHKDTRPQLHSPTQKHTHMHEQRRTLTEPGEAVGAQRRDYVFQESKHALS